MKTRKTISNVLSHILLAVLGIIWVLPIFYVVLTAFREEGGSYKSYIFPKGYTLDNFINLINTSNSSGEKQTAAGKPGGRGSSPESGEA